MQDGKKIPVVIGVTGHRNIVEEDKPELKKKVIESLMEIRGLCKGKNGGEDTPVIMLNAFAQGADMLCAEAAFELGIDVYAVLPCKEEKYKQSFDLYQAPFKEAGITSGKEYEEAVAKDEADIKKLDEYLSRVRQGGARITYAPDIEKNKAWLKKTINIPDDSYDYRQLGIYMAEHSHILLALWDGEAASKEYGCGTVEVIKFALEHKFLDKDKLFKPGMINDSAVVWIKSRRSGGDSEADIKKQWMISGLVRGEGKEYQDYLTLDKPPVFLEKIIAKTVEYNCENADDDGGKVKLWKNVDELDEYRKSLRRHYIKADRLSYGKNQKKYFGFLFWLAVLGTLVACTFLIYDDASLPYLIFPCTVAVVLVLWLVLYGKRKQYHKNYIEYRAFAEALRIQFYTSMCLTKKSVNANVNVCDLYAWSQKVDRIWIDKAIQALWVISNCTEIKVDKTAVIDAWIGYNEDTKGQLGYHNEKKGENLKKLNGSRRWAAAFKICTIAIYFAIFVMEVVACALKAFNIDWFWGNAVFAGVTCRNLAAIVLGTVTAGSLLVSSYWGKLSYDRKLDDNEKMSRFYSSAYERWNEVKGRDEETDRFIIEIAREEIVENGIWCSYVSENGFEVNI